MSDIKIVDWPLRPAEQRRDELEKENAELRKLVEQMRDALRLALPEARSTHCENTIVAALKAAEGNGE